MNGKEQGGLPLNAGDPMHDSIAAGESESVSNRDTFTRRDVFRLVAGIALERFISTKEAALATDVVQGASTEIIPNYAFALHENNPEESIVEDVDSLFTAIDKEVERHDGDKAELVNNATATAVTAVFAGCLAGVAAEKFQFSPKTIAAVGAAELGRLALLAKYDPEHAKHEMQLITQSIGIVGVLVIISDMASESRASVGSLLKGTKLMHDLPEILALEETHLGKHKLPNLNLPHVDIEECEELSATYTDEIIRLAAGGQALSTFLGPLSTYISGRAAADTEKPIARAVTKLFYTQRVAEAKREGEKIDHRAFQQHAAERADQVMNGHFGYKNVKIANDTNLAGAGVIGDPPLIASYITNPNIQNHIRVTVDGLTLNQITGTVNTITWLMRSGIIKPSEIRTYVRQYGVHVLKAMDSLADTLKDSDMRDVSFASADKRSDELTKRLTVLGKSGVVTSEQLANLQEFFLTTPDPIIEFDPSDWLSRKREAVVEAFSHDKSDDIAMIIEEMEGKSVEDQLRRIFRYSDPNRKAEALFHLNEDERVENQAELTKIFIELLSPTTGSPESLPQRILDIGTKIGLSSTDIPLKVFDKVVEQKRASAVEIDAIADSIGRLGKLDVERAYNDSLDEYRGITTEHDAHMHGEKQYILSHIGREVRDTVTTQVLGVEAAVRLNTVALPMLAGFKPGETLSSASFDKARLIILGQTMAISKVGDNVAAYFFGKQMMESLYQQYFGEEFAEDEGLQYYANAAPLLAAVVAGAGSKIGNGPNFQLYETETTIAKNREIIVKEKPMKLGKSFANPYAWGQELLVFSFLASTRSGSVMYDNIGNAFEEIRS